MKKLREISDEHCMVVNITKRPHEFSHFNDNIRRQIFNTHIPVDQRHMFAKIFASNTIESIEKFGYNASDIFISPSDTEWLVNHSNRRVVDYPSWVIPYDGKIDLRKETLLHFPYDSFNDLLRSIGEHCEQIDQLILSVYRLADKSEIVRLITYLMKMGVSVTIMIEINAKGNEESNIKYAHQLKMLGAQVIISDSPKKNHAKFIHIIWDDHTDTTMIMTGNLNESTAHIYEDYCMITSKQDIVLPMKSMIMRLITSNNAMIEDSNTVFFTQSKAVSTLLHEIKKQCDLGEKGQIIIKCNLFTDPTFMGILEYAAECGCHVIVICRGECCFKPINKNIEVHRFIHKYLEHSRVYAFGRNNSDVYIGSLDFATHKLFGRFELICHIDDINMQNSIMSTIKNMLNDDTERHYHLTSKSNIHQYRNGGKIIGEVNTRSKSNRKLIR